MNFFEKKLKSREKEGFSLLETTIAVTVLTVAVLGALSVLVFSLRGAIISRENLIAANLAQEALEIVRNIRDTNWLGGYQWDDGLADGVYLVSWETNTLLPYQDTFLLYDGTNQGYNYSFGSPSIFKRKVTLTHFGTNQIKVVVEVRWVQAPAVTKTLTVESRLYDWK